MGTEIATRRAARSRASAGSSSGSTARSRHVGANPACRSAAVAAATWRGACPSSYSEQRTMSPGARTLLGGRGPVVRRQLRPLAEEELVRLLEEDRLPARRGEVEPVLVDDHLRVLQPQLPGLLGDAVVDLLAQLVVERLVDDAWKLLAELRAHDDARFCHGASERILRPPSGIVKGAPSSTISSPARDG